MNILAVRTIAVCSALALLAPLHVATGNELTAPALSAEIWLNAEPTTLQALRGNVVLVEFWTYGCYNCRNVEPYIKQWHKKYAGQGLVVLAIHSPEFRHERNLDNVNQYVKDNDISYPVLIDNDFSTWNDFDNRAWPTIYLIDKTGHIVYSKIGEGAYDTTEARIVDLLAMPRASR